jgi:hypothetical protein
MKITYKITRTITALIVAAFIGLVPVTTSLALDTKTGACTGNDSAPCQASGDSIAALLGSVISLLLFIAGAIAVLVIVVGGIRYITSDGDPSAASKAKNTIIYALVGLVVAVMSYSIVNFVIGRI